MDTDMDSDMYYRTWITGHGLQDRDTDMDTDMDKTWIWMWTQIWIRTWT